MRYLTATDERKIKAAMEAKGSKCGKILRVLIGCIIEIPVENLGNGDEEIQQVIDRCQEYGTGEIVDVKVVTATEGRAM